MRARSEIDANDRSGKATMFARALPRASAARQAGGVARGRYDGLKSAYARALNCWDEDRTARAAAALNRISRRGLLNEFD
jgi:hypothetical protein